MKTITLSASLLLTTMFINAQDLASKIIGNYKQTSVTINFGQPIIPNTAANFEIVKREDNLIDLKATIKTTTTIQGVRLIEKNGTYILYYSDPSGSLYGTVSNGTLEYTLLYVDSKTAKVSAISQKGTKQ